eukprot:3518661-Ditylum_brightwellii.AAC.1
MVRTLEPLPDENGWWSPRTVTFGTRAQREYQNAFNQAPQGVKLKEVNACKTYKLDLMSRH